MKHAWSFFWLIVAWCVALTFIASFVMPYLWVIALIVFLAIGAFIGFKVWRSMSDRRSHF